MTLADIRPLADILFADTVTARMLRRLAAVGSMTQADFMTEYHGRCQRAKPSRSSFGNQFGRYTVTWRGYRLALIAQEQIQPKLGSNGETRMKTTYMTVRDGTVVSGWSRIATGREPIRPSRNIVAWIGPRIEDVIDSLNDKDLGAVFERMEYAMLNPRKTDPEDEFTPLVVLLRKKLDLRNARSAP